MKLFSIGALALSITFIVFFSLSSVSNAQSYPNVTIYLTNVQNVSTGLDFQQMVVTNSSAVFQNISSDGGNVRFYIGQTELYSWRENATMWWIKLPDGIPADSQIALNMTFLQMSTEFDGVYAGEAPQLSSAYAQYDNGASVFINYTRWGGLSAIPPYYAWYGSAANSTFNPTNTVLSNCSSNPCDLFETAPANLTSYPFVFDLFGDLYNGNRPPGGFYGLYSGTDFPSCSRSIAAIGSSTTLEIMADSGCASSTVNYSDSDTNKWYTYEADDYSTANIFINYSLQISQTGAADTVKSYFGTTVGFYEDVSDGYTLAISRARVPPPNGVMPQVEFSAGGDEESHMLSGSIHDAISAVVSSIQNSAPIAHFTGRSITSANESTNAIAANDLAANAITANAIVGDTGALSPRTPHSK
jgi:hypothetical protein